MVMTYTSLAAPKGTAGSIANWSNSTKIDVATVISEAESLVYNVMRVREMRAEWVFGMAIGDAQIALPARFLDPVGQIFDLTNYTMYPQKTVTEAMRVFDAEQTYPINGGAQLGLTFVSGSSLVALYVLGIGAGAGDTVRLANVTAQPDVNIIGAFPVVRAIDANNVVIDIDQTPTTSRTTMFTSATVTAVKQTRGSPSRWCLSDEKIKFDVAFDAAATLKLDYYRSPLPLSSDNPSNWLVSRYPMLMRKACQAAAADFLKDDAEYQKHLTAMTALASTLMGMDDLSLRGAEFGTDTP